MKFAAAKLLLADAENVSGFHDAHDAGDRPDRSTRPSVTLLVSGIIIRRWSAPCVMALSSILASMVPGRIRAVLSVRVLPRC